MKPYTIMTYQNSDIDQVLRIILQLAKGEAEREHVPWMTGLYFAGATLCVDTNLPDREDTYTFNHTKESVGFFSGGVRRLLSIKACKMLEEIMVLSDINHTKKWLL
jgi:hypothetical protein